MKEQLIKLSALALIVAAACTVPVRNYDAAQIQAVTDLEELMHVNATVADPRFELAEDLEGQTPSTEQWADFLDMGMRLQVTSRQGMHFSMGEGFDAYMLKLGEQAAELEQAVRAQEAERSLNLVLDIESTCRDCHRQYK